MNCLLCVVVVASVVGLVGSVILDVWFAKNQITVTYIFEMAAIVVTVMYLYRGYTQENNIIVVNTFEVTILFQFLHLIFLNLHAMFGQ